MEFSRQEYWNGLPFPALGESSWPRDWTRVSCVAGTFFTIWRKSQSSHNESNETWRDLVMCLHLQTQITGSNVNLRVYFSTCALKNYTLLFLEHVKLEGIENSQYDILQVRVRKLSFPEFIYLVQTRQVGFNVNKRPNWILIILKSLWKGQDLELEVKDSNSETWWISIDHSISVSFFE